MDSNAQPETKNPELSKLRAPYPSWPAFLSVFEKIKSRSGTIIDAEILQKWDVSAPNARKILPALRFLGIIDQDGNPLPLWTALAVKDPTRYRKTAEDMLSQAYKKLLDAYPNVFLETDIKLSDAIGDVYDTSASTRTAAVNFLKRMLTEAGLRELRETPQRQPERRHSLPRRAPLRPAEQHVSGGTTTIRASDAVLNVHVHVANDVSEDELVDFFRRVNRAKNRVAAENG